MCPDHASATWVVALAAVLLAGPAHSQPTSDPVFSTTFVDAVTAGNGFLASDGKRYFDIDPGADDYQNDVYERPTVSTYEVRQLPGGGERFGSAEYFEYLDISEGRAGFDEQYLYVAIDLVGHSILKDDGSSDLMGLVERYGFRIGVDPDGAGSIFAFIDQPELKLSPPTAWGSEAVYAFEDQNGDVGGQGRAIAKEDDESEADGDGYEEEIVSDGQNQSGQLVLFVRIDPSDDTIVQFALDYAGVGLSQEDLGNLTYLEFEAIKGGPADPPDHLWNDQYTKEEAGSPYRATTGDTSKSEFGTQGLGNIYEGDSLVGGPIVSEPPAIAITSPQDGALFATTPVTVTGTIEDAAAVDVSGVAATVTGGTWTADVPLVEGANTLVASATNEGGTSTDEITVALDTTAPVVTITSPADGTLTALAEVTVTGTVFDVSAIVRFEVQGAAVSLVAGAFSTSVALAVGVNSIAVVAEDAAGNTAPAAISVERGAAPSISMETPESGDLLASIAILVRGTISGTGSVQVDVNGVAAALLDPVTYEATLELEDGPLTITAIASSSFGTAQVSIDVDVDRSPPDLLILTPTDGEALSTATTLVTGQVSDANGVTSVSVEGRPTAFAGGFFTAEVALELGSNIIRITAADAPGNIAESVLTVVRGDPPTVSLDPLAAGGVVVVSPLAVSGSATNADSVTVAGEATPVVDDRFSISVALQPEQTNVITAIATNAFGQASDSLNVGFEPPPAIAITEPAPNTNVTAATVIVRGTVSDEAATIDVNGVPAAVTAGSPPEFEATVAVGDGKTILVARATDAQGRAATAAVEVVRDASPPIVFIDSPAPDHITFASSIQVSGVVRDLVSDELRAEGCQVDVNGVAAQVERQRFTATVPLLDGVNELVATATDGAGNSAESSIDVTFVAAAAEDRLLLESGNEQTGLVATLLPSPVEVRLFAAAGTPLVDTQVVFRVERNDGLVDIAGGSGAGAARFAVVRTDATGRAAVSWLLGGNAGIATNTLEITSPGIANGVTASASGLALAPTTLKADLGDNQSGAAGQQLPLPFTVVVMDDEDNRLPGVDVVFRVLEGGGSFSGAADTRVETDGNGIAGATLTLGALEGIASNVVTAEIAGAAPAARFSASALIPGPAADTAVVGVVFDNTDTPIPGATLHIEGTSLTTTSDAAGQFRIDGAPVGFMALAADASTSSRPGPWGHLRFELTTVSGRDNSLGMPIYFPRAVNTGSASVDETTGATIELPGQPGLSLIVEPGAATFAGGSKAGVVSITPVHSDKLPMTPNRGAQPLLPISIQPSSVHFDPPARLSVPNVEGLPPGRVVEVYSFDHDIERFVNVGTGSVSEDGSVVVTDPGVGVIKGGWHFAAPPVDSGDGQNTSVRIE